MSSAGHFGGVLDRIVIDGTADVPDFSLDLSDRPVPLQTRFHAIVDGRSGDTYLQPVTAHLLHSDFTVTGKIVKVAGQDHTPPGHDVQLQVSIPHGRIEDFLRLAVKTSPPLMNGTLHMQADLRIPPGNVRVPEKLSMAGSVSLTDVQFNNRKTQKQIDSLSARAQGRPEDVLPAGSPGTASPLPIGTGSRTRSTLNANFTLSHAVLGITDVHYTVPGAAVLLNGVYSLDGRLFEFKGLVRTEATASAMVGGWKGLLLQPLDRFLQKHGAGVELPVEISGANGDVHFGLASQGTQGTPAQMLAEVKGRVKAKGEMATARTASAQADAEDAAAARAPTLAAAEQLHAAAVRHRAEAQRQASAAVNATGNAAGNLPRNAPVHPRP